MQDPSRPRRAAVALFLLAFVAGAVALSCATPQKPAEQHTTAAVSTADAAPAAAQTLGSGSDPVARGRFLVEVLGCGDCHSPRLPEGRLDPDFIMAGHKEKDPYPSWNDSLFTKGFGMLVSTSGTAFAGPWGVTFARNLTPDKTTGIGGWNEEAFMNVLREGTLKPPMPSTAYGKLPDEDLKAMFAYLQSLKPVKNQVPFRELTPPRLPGEIPGQKQDKKR
ncbi:MAG: c-type cytochrome [Candidatus Eiseniibacteriota bacterium]